MNGFFITNLDDNHQGGLFYATFERVKRHSMNMETTIINNNFNLRKEDQYVFKGLNIINMNYKRTIAYIIDKFITSRQEEKLVSSYISKFDNQLSKSDFIHAHWGWPFGYIAYRLAQEYSIPYFITFHGSDINSMKKRNTKNILKSMENASKCFFVSHALLKTAINKGYSGHNSVVNYNGVDLSEFQLKNSKSQTIGYVGTLMEKKGADLLPLIYKKIYDNDKNLSFKIIGDGPLREKIHNKVKKLGIDKKVDFLGQIPKDYVATLMKDFDLLIVPSRKEGLGMVILEANACGVPVVGSNRGGIPEAIGNRENYFSLDENFIENISERAINIIRDKNYRKNSIRLRKRIKEEFTWEKSVIEEEKIYKETVKD